VKSTGCRQLAELRSAYLDGVLADVDRERVLAHLVGCAGCRAELEELRNVRQLLNRMGTSAEASAASNDLSSRLVSIAGRDAYLPVWSRPFRRTRAGALPSARRRTRIRASATALAFGGLLSTLGALGYAAAPSRDLPTWAEPSDRVRSEFASTLTQFPLASRSINALMMTPKSDLSSQTGQPSAVLDPSAVHRAIPAAAAIAALRRATDDADQVSYSGTQQVVASRGDETISASVEIASEAGQGSSLSVFNQAGREVVNGFVPAASSSRIVDREMLSLLLQHYAISGWTGSSVVGRPVTVVEASADGSRVGEPPAARWWIDQSTGLLLRQESYDPAGALVLAARFTTLNVTGKPIFMEHLAPRLAVSTTTASLTLSNVADLVRRGWYCRDRLSGLSLVRLRSDEPLDPGVLHMVYSDGVSTLSVFEQHGKLSGPPTDSHLDNSLHAYVRAGTPNMATWQSGDTVFTVVTDGSFDLVTDAVQTLPHERPIAPTTMGQVRAGWVRILDRVVG
jgi:hypothetical protein